MKKETLNKGIQLEYQIGSLNKKKNKYKDILEYLVPSDFGKQIINIDLHYRESKRLTLINYTDCEELEKENTKFSISERNDFEGFLKDQIIKIDKEILNLQDEFDKL